MGDEQNRQAKSRLERLEHLMELLIDDHPKFSDEHNLLLKAQVLLTEAQKRTEQQLQGFTATTEKAFAELREAHKQTEESMTALIRIVDDLIRKPQRPQ
jgi:retron-type reverse transcriptase